MSKKLTRSEKQDDEGEKIWWEADIWERHEAMFPDLRREVIVSLSHDQIGYLMDLVSEAVDEEEANDEQPVAKFIYAALSLALEHASKELASDIDSEEERKVRMRDRREAGEDWDGFLAECKAAVKGSRRRA
jgi:hypothetical protein